MYAVGDQVHLKGDKAPSTITQTVQTIRKGMIYWLENPNYEERYTLSEHEIEVNKQ